MSPQEETKLSAMFQQAVEMDPAVRQVWLSGLRRDQPTLAGDLEGLLEADEAGAGLFRTSPWAVCGRGQAAANPAFGPYRVIREIGRGGSGIVYECLRNDDVFCKRVAVKLLRQPSNGTEMARRFQVERQILASLEHPHIARVLDGGSDGQNRPYMAMEFVEGRPWNVFCELEQSGEREIAAQAVQLCGALSYLHERQIIHCDVKPGNVLVTRDGVLKLLDFSVARPEGLAALIPGGEANGEIVSGYTPGYASPEQRRGEPAGPRTDIYSAGRVLQELLRKVPVAQGPVSADLGAIADKAANPAAAHRYATAAAMQADLSQFLAGRSVAARRWSLAEGASRMVRRHPLWVVAAIVLLATTSHGAYRSWESASMTSRVAAQQSEIEHLLALLDHALTAGDRDGVVQGLSSLEDEYRRELSSVQAPAPGMEIRLRPALLRTIALMGRAEQAINGDAGLRTNLARLYAVVGELQADQRHGLSDPAGALAAYRKANALLENVAHASSQVAHPARLRSPQGRELAALETTGPVGAITEAATAQPAPTPEPAANPAKLEWVDQQTVTLARVKYAASVLETRRRELQEKGMTLDSRHEEAMSRCQDLVQRADRLVDLGDYAGAADRLRRAEQEATRVLREFGR